MKPEFWFLWASLSTYVAAGSLAVTGALLGRRFEKSFIAITTTAIILLSVFAGMRWARLGHGPFVTMFDILYSNLLSLSLIFILAYWRIKQIRPIAALIFPFMFVMIAWLAVSDSADEILPPTFDTIWLVFHVAFGKIFLGSALVAGGIAVVILLRRFSPFVVAGFARLPNDESLDELAYRFMAMGLVFDTLMLVSGAVWAQDAWGRYWAWEPLETWSFITWLLLASALHARVTYKMAPLAFAVMIIVVFALAFLTLFGIPFVTERPHQGVV